MGITVDDRFHPDLTEAVRRLVDHFQPDRIYLFGSQARGDAGTDSDYDILVVVPDQSRSGFPGTYEAMEVISDVGLPIEPLVMSREQFDRQESVIASLAETVTREGTLLYDQ